MKQRVHKKQKNKYVLLVCMSFRSTSHEGKKRIILHFQPRSDNSSSLMREFKIKPHFEVISNLGELYIVSCVLRSSFITCISPFEEEVESYC